jgi:hypothetical protein
LLGIMDDEQRKDVRRRFADAVNMEPADLRSWLRTDASKSVGWPKDRAPGVESVGHASGRRILKLLRTSAGALTEDDYAHMRKVAGYVARHLKQRPRGDVSDTRWRYSLMNWGHDPLK